jgi:hypothetical protein
MLLVRPSRRTPDSRALRKSTHAAPLVLFAGARTLIASRAIA